MYRDLFPGESTTPPIKWLAYVEASGRCRAKEFIEGLEEIAQSKLLARMRAFAVLGRWDTKTSMIRMLQGTEVPIYEIKSHQERFFFVRCRNDAVAVMGFSKKSTKWGNKEQREIDASMALFKRATHECRQGPRS